MRILPVTLQSIFLCLISCITYRIKVPYKATFTTAFSLNKLFCDCCSLYSVSKFCQSNYPSKGMASKSTATYCKFTKLISSNVFLKAKVLSTVSSAECGPHSIRNEKLTLLLFTHSSIIAQQNKFMSHKPQQTKEFWGKRYLFSKVNNTARAVDYIFHRRAFI